MFLACLQPTMFELARKFAGQRGRLANHGYEHYIHNLEIVWTMLRKFGYNDQLIRPSNI